MEFAFPTVRRAALLLVMAAIAGCAGTSKGHWGGDVGWSGGAGLKSAAVKAVIHPSVWLPVAGAAVLAIDDFDNDVSDWISDDAAVFGSDAADLSDNLQNATAAAYLLTALAAPSDGAGNKFRGLGVGVGTLLLTGATTEGLKEVTQRDRPNGGRNNSFPSGHASQSSARASLASANLDYIDMPQWARSGSRVLLQGAAISTAWARVEAEKHYASDALVGYAIGRFFALFMQEAFFNAGGEPAALISYQPMQQGGALTLTVKLGMQSSHR